MHTWPEDGFAAVDIFTSGDTMKPELAIAILEEAFNADRVDIVTVSRGALNTRE